MNRQNETRTHATLWALVLSALALLLVPAARADTVFNQPPDPAGGHYKSAWYPPDGLDGDQYVWDDFTLAANTAVSQIQWRGCYTNYLSGAGKAPVFDFTVSIYPSISGDFQPDVTHPPLVRYHTNNNAGETLVGTFGGVLMYDYHFTLPSAFQAVAGTKYWVQIVASQGLTPTYYWPPDWSLAKGTGGNGAHFEYITGANYRNMSGDIAFMLLTSGGATWTINASASPSYAGTVQGAGSYPVNSQVTLVATPNAGYGFVNWTENGAQVSTNATYKFTATKDRTLVANFVPAYPVTTSSYPTYGGTTSGGGTFNQGKSVTVTATPRAGYLFQNWTWYGNVMSTSPSYTFTVTGATPLQANFAPGPNTVPFDLDHGTPPPLAQYTSTPFFLTVDGVTAHFYSPQDSPAFSLQNDGTLFYHQVNLNGNYLWPDSIYRNDLYITFSKPVTTISLDFATVEMESWADVPSPLVLTAYNDSTSNPPVGSAQAAGVYAGTTYPEGTLVFTSAQPFNLVTLTVGSNPFFTNNFMSDNYSVTTVPCACPADFDCSGFVDFDDFNAFVIAFEAGADNADFDGSGFVDFDDFNAFVVAFEAGC